MGESDIDTIGLIVTIVAVLTVLIAAKLQKRKIKLLEHDDDAARFVCDGSAWRIGLTLPHGLNPV
jgi:hypothetical protein